MPLSISRKVFFSFLALTLVILSLGATINYSLVQIAAGKEKTGTLHAFMMVLSDIGHFHAGGPYHLSFHEDTPRFRETLDRLQDHGDEISDWEEYREIEQTSLFHINDQISYFRSAAMELLAGQRESEVINAEIGRLSAELRKRIPSHGSAREGMHQVLHQSYNLMNSALANSHEDIDLPTLSRLKKLPARFREEGQAAAVVSLLDRFVLSCEKKYLSQLAIADRESYLAETSRHFRENAGRVRDHILDTTRRQEDRIRALIILVVLLTAAVTLVLWFLATKRLRTFIRNFGYSLDSIARGDYRYELPDIIRDELGEALLFAKKLSLNLEEEIRQKALTEREREKLQGQLLHAQKMESVGRLAGGIAHDFNNLLMGVTGYCELALLEIESDHPCRAYLRGILESGEKAASLTAQLLAFSRKQVLEKRSLSLNGLVSEQGRMLDRMLGEDIDLDLDLGEDIGSVFGDPGQIAQVIMNLAINARDSMPRGGRLTIATAAASLDEDYTRDHAGLQPGRYVEVTVTDTGEGMSRTVQERAFEPFFTTKEVGKGTGLGLATVFGIVRQHGGHVWLYSDEGKGTTIKVYLPVSDEEGPAVLENPGWEEVPRGTETVLVVDDNPEVLDVVGRALTSHGYTLHSAGGGRDALALLKEPDLEIDLLLTDVVMPGMSGLELAEEAKRFRPDLKVIFMSGNADRVLLPEDLPGRLDRDLLQKPVMPTSLLRKVRNILNGNRIHGGDS